jgi:(1->4)-alpha-D-glucan 1-alpha-D-glucosylmutase
MAERVGTYRWQLTPDRGFEAAAAAAPDLAALGVSHLYLSPVAEAVPGSTHGYDVTDPTRLREELGGPAGFAALAEACRAHGLALLVDVVPNHLAAHDANPWWWDLLRLGRGSRYAEVFDVDWGSADALVLPVLGDHYGRELEAGTLALSRGPRPGRIIVVRYHDRTFPVRPETEGAVLAEVARRVDDDLLGVAARVLARAEEPTAQPHEREADLAVAERTVLGRLAEPAIARALDEELAAITADVDRLDLVLAQQHHRLARWTVGDAEVEYRRFFDVDSLAATRMEAPPTFDLLHRLTAELLDLDVVDGLRIDHVDGLADPARYLAALRELAGPSTWIVVEKILRRDEPLPEGWPVAGTTGYEVADLLGGWLTDPEGAAVLRRGWADRTGEDRDYDEVARAARREVLEHGFAADRERVVDALRAVCRGRRRHRDHTRSALRAVVVELAVHLGRYRTYVSPGGGPIDPGDRALLEACAAAARRSAPDLDPELVDLVLAVLTGDWSGPAEAQVITRFQQLTGPVAAKGEEDTALYRWLPVPHRCEVGTDPGLPPTTAAEWHAAAAEAQARWPERLTTLSTHDSKRSADARARLAALTGDPTGALEAFDRWWDAAGGAGDGGIDPGTAWLAFHALVAAWPIDGERAWTVIEKSAREAGLRTSWVRPHPGFEAALHDLVRRALDDPVARAVLDELVAVRADAADGAALAQLAVQLLAPGVPDVYQGGEAWDRSLVDPDNRRPPDPVRRAELVAAAGEVDAATAWARPELRRAGLPRTILLHTALGARRRHPAVVGPGPAGAYRPLVVDGPHASRVLAFTRGEPARLAVVAVRPACAVAADATVELPGGEWQDLLGGGSWHGRVELEKLLDRFPVALLEG